MADKTNETKALSEQEPYYKDQRMAKISKNLGDIVAERKKMLLQNQDRENRVSSSITLTVGFNTLIPTFRVDDQNQKIRHLSHYVMKQYGFR